MMAGRNICWPDIAQFEVDNDIKKMAYWNWTSVFVLVLSALSNITSAIVYVLRFELEPFYYYFM